MQTTESLFRFNRKMRMVALVVAVLSVAMGVMLWRHYQLKGLGQDSRYQAPMRHYSTGEKKMIRGNFDGALKEYQQAKSMLEEIPGIDLSQDFYYGIVLNGIGTIHLRVGIYGRETKPSAIKAGLDPDYEKIRESLAYFKSSERIYTTWLAGNRPTAAAITHLEDSRKGKKSEDIVLQPFERYERALSVVYTNLGIASRYLGETQQAMAYYRQALAAWPDQKAAKGNLETLLEAMEPARPDGAAEPVSETAADQ